MRFIFSVIFTSLDTVVHAKEGNNFPPSQQVRKPGLESPPKARSKLKPELHTPGNF
jgi:hypothetical protein